MGKFKVVASGVFAASFLSTAGFAADLPTLKLDPAVPAPIHDWSGCYLGAFGGWDFNHTDTSMAAVDTVTTTTKGKTTKKVTSVAASGGQEFNGGEFGGRVGCQRQFGQFVLGGEFGGGGLGFAGTPQLNNALGALAGTARLRGGGFGEVTLKVGYAVTDRALLFVRGGAGYLNAATTFFDSKSNYLGRASNNGIFGTIGGGVEYRVNDRIGVTAEYGYMGRRCGSTAFNASISATETFVGAGRGCVTQSSATFGINYYFPTTWPMGPVAAKY